MCYFGSVYPEFASIRHFRREFDRFEDFWKVLIVLLGSPWVLRPIFIKSSFESFPRKYFHSNLLKKYFFLLSLVFCNCLRWLFLILFLRIRILCNAQCFNFMLFFSSFSLKAMQLSTNGPSQA